MFLNNEKHLVMSDTDSGK